MGKLVTPFRVGLMLLLALGVFVVFFSFVHKGGLSKRDSLTTWAYFHDASGLGPKSRIQIAGISVGEITSVTLEGNLAKVTMLIKRSVPVKTDAVILKRSESLLGDYLLDLNPGTEAAPLMPEEGQITHVQDQSGVNQIFNSLAKVTDDIEAVTSALRNTLGGDKGALSLQHIVANLSQMTDQLNRTIQLNGERLDAILINFQGVSEDIRHITGSEEERYRAIVENVQRITEDVRDVLAQVKGMLGTGEGNMKQTVASLRDTLEKINKSLDNVQEITTKVNSGEGTIGQLINDKRIGQALTDTVVDASSYVSSLVNLQTEVSLRTEYLFNQRTTKNYLQLRLIPKPDKYYTFAIVDDPQGLTTQTVVQRNPPGSEEASAQTITTTTQTLKYSAQFNKRFSFATVRFGIIESTGGLGVDLHFLKDSLTIKGDVFDFSDLNRSYPRLKVYANYAFLNHLFLTGGMDDIANPPVRDASTRQLLTGRELFLGGGIYFTDDDLKAILGSVPLP